MPDPLAYYLTWRTYGTWLPGDERGWVQRGGGWHAPDPIRKLEAEAWMTEGACILDREQRQVVEKTIADHCRIRDWELYEVNCRSNHVHVVVSANIRPEAVRSQLKAWCARKLKELEKQRIVERAREDNVDSVTEVNIREHWWAERGSRLYVNDENALEAVCQYVRDGQDDPEHRR
jgi:REP element-mobilizing transposase RayT